MNIWVSVVFVVYGLFRWLVRLVICVGLLSFVWLFCLLGVLGFVGCCGGNIY